MIRRRLKHAAAWRLKAVTDRLDSVIGSSDTADDRLHEIEAKLASIDASVRALAEAAASSDAISSELAAIRSTIDERLEPMLRAVVEQESESRRKLYAARADPLYESAYADGDPLVSIILPTVAREQLTSRALPSLLAQTHSNIEIIVVGDNCPPQTAEAIEALGDARIRYSNLSQRLLPHADPRRSALVGSTMARNEAARSARGAWLLHFDDDDHLRPDAIARLLAVARGERAEVSYGGFEAHTSAGDLISEPVFPPEWEHFAWPAALVHGSLGFIERELIAADLGLPGDMFMLTRMLRVGVRFARLEEIVLDYFPSRDSPQSIKTASPSVLVSGAEQTPSILN